MSEGDTRTSPTRSSKPRSPPRRCAARLINQILTAKFEAATKRRAEREHRAVRRTWMIRDSSSCAPDISQKASSGVELVTHASSSPAPPRRARRRLFPPCRAASTWVTRHQVQQQRRGARRRWWSFSGTSMPSRASPAAEPALTEVRDNGRASIPVEKSTHSLCFTASLDHKTGQERVAPASALVIIGVITECMGDIETPPSPWSPHALLLPHALRTRRPRRWSTDVQRRPRGGERRQKTTTRPTRRRTISWRRSLTSRMTQCPPPGRQRALFHPSVSDNTRKHVGCILKCFGARPGVHYVTVQREEQLSAKVRQAAQLGSPIM